jgi:hypothetical protein
MVGPIGRQVGTPIAVKGRSPILAWQGGCEGGFGRRLCAPRSLRQARLADARLAGDDPIRQMPGQRDRNERQ